MWEKGHPVWDKFVHYFIYFEIMDIPASTAQVVTRFLVKLSWEGPQWSIKSVLKHLHCSELFSPFSCILTTFLLFPTRAQCSLHKKVTCSSEAYWMRGEPSLRTLNELCRQHLAYTLPSDSPQTVVILKSFVHLKESSVT